MDNYITPDYFVFDLGRRASQQPSFDFILPKHTHTPRRRVSRLIGVKLARDRQQSSPRRPSPKTPPKQRTPSSRRVSPIQNPRTPSPPASPVRTSPTKTIMVPHDPAKYGTISGYGNLLFERVPNTEKAFKFYFYNNTRSSYGFGKLMAEINDITPVYAAKLLMKGANRHIVKPKHVYVQALNGQVAFEYTADGRYRRVK